MTSRERWWHVYVGHNDEMHAVITMTLGASSEHPEQLVARGATVIELGDDAWMGPATLRYGRSYLYEPSGDQLADLREAMGFERLDD